MIDSRWLNPLENDFAPCGYRAEIQAVLKKMTSLKTVV